MIRDSVTYVACLGLICLLLGGLDITAESRAISAESAGQVCGNNAAEGDEVCDGTDLRAASCISQGHDAGDLSCRADCNAYDISSCESRQCGNGKVEAGELCDGRNLNGKTCRHFGYRGGSLSCRYDCAVFDKAKCLAPPPRAAGVTFKPEYTWDPQEATPRVFMEAQTVPQDSTLIDVQIWVSYLTNIGQARFKLYYDQNVVEFLGAVEGPFMNRGGQSDTLFVAEDPERDGSLVVDLKLLEDYRRYSAENGATTFDWSSFPNLVNQKKLLTTLRFKQLLATNSALTFSNNSLKYTWQDTPRVTWNAGRLAGHK